MLLAVGKACLYFIGVFIPAPSEICLTLESYLFYLSYRKKQQKLCYLASEDKLRCLHIILYNKNSLRFTLSLMF